MNQAVFAAGLRTPFGKAHKGAYADVRPDDLLIELLGEHRQRHAALWEAAPEDLVCGCAYPEGEQGYNMARMVAVGCGLECPGTTVNRLCASSLEAAALAAARVRCGWGTRYLVTGVESMSRIPRRGANFSPSPRIEQVYPGAYTPNGDTAERVARQYEHLSRARQEDLAARSHELAHEAYQRGDYQDQVYPFEIDKDEFIRFPVDRDKMASLPPAFAEDGVVTAATSSPLTDGACCGWVLERGRAAELRIGDCLEIVDAVVAHVPPEVMGLGPIPATRKLLERNQLSADALAAVEINEAFAIQVLACLEQLELPLDRVNGWGGAMAVGHPLGASGLRLLITLLGRLRQRGEPDALGLATLCVGGGQGMSVLVRYHKQA